MLLHMSIWTFTFLHAAHKLSSLADIGHMICAGGASVGYPGLHTMGMGGLSQMIEIAQCPATVIPKPIPGKGSSKFRGVSWHKDNLKWRATIFKGAGHDVLIFAGQ